MALKDYRVSSRPHPKAVAWKAHSPRLLYNNTVGRCSVTDFRCEPSECHAIMRLSAFYSDQVRLTRFARNPASWLAGSQVMTQPTWLLAFPKLTHRDEIVNIFAQCWEIILYIINQTIGHGLYGYIHHSGELSWSCIRYRPLWTDQVMALSPSKNHVSKVNKYCCQTWPNRWQVRHSIHTYKIMLTPCLSQ